MSRKTKFKEMKKVLFIVTFTSAFAVLTAFTTSNTNTNSAKTTVTLDSDFCEGWKDGYCEGWKDVKGQLALCPLTPLCPLPEIGQDTYKGGYNRGFKAGSGAAQR